MKTTIKTISWENGGAIFLEEARRVWGEGLKQTPLPCEFMSFISGLPDLSLDQLTYWIDNITNTCQLQNVTETVTESEDKCLSMVNDERPVVLGILIDYLRDYKKDLEGWYYLDNKKQAIAHFVKRCDNTYYVELYCLDCLGTTASYLHFTAEGYQKLLIPVNFMDTAAFNLCKRQCESLNASVLRDYLLRHELGFLRTCHRGNRPNLPQTGRIIDEGDLL